MSTKPYLRATFERLTPEKLHTDHAGKDLDEAEAWAFAQLIKRLSWVDLRGCAESDAEAHLMGAAVAKVQRALDNAGVSPR